MIFTVAFILIGLILLIYSTEALLQNIEASAKYLGMNSFIVKIIVLGFGTSLPELFTSISASALGKYDVIVFNVIGSNVTNILVSGGIALLSASYLKENIKKHHMLFSALSALLFIFFIYINALFSLYTGLLLLALFITYNTINLLEDRPSHSYRLYIKNSLIIFLLVSVSYIIVNESIKLSSINFTSYSAIIFTGALVIALQILKRFTKNPLANILIMIALVLCIIISSTWLITFGLQFITAFNLSDKFLGVILVSIGTSLPEITIAVIGFLKKQTSAIFANIIGSNIFNILFIPSMIALASPSYSNMNFAFMYLDILLLTGATLLLVYLTSFSKIKPAYNKYFGLAMIGCWIVYIGGLS